MKPSVALVLLLAMAACGHAATRPSVPRDADLATREAVYEAHELSYVDRLGSRSFRRDDGTYALRHVEGLATAFPESKDAYDTVKARSLAVTLVSGLGGGLIGFTAGMQLSPTDGNQRISTRAALTLYGAGAALIIIGLVLDRTWAREAAQDLAAAYNQGLRRDLGLP